MRVVIDTNILISGSFDESSYAFRIIKEVIEGRIEAYATHQTMRENRQMLRKLVKDREYRRLLEDFFRKLRVVKPRRRIKIVFDPEDNKLFESAVAANADFLISEDQDVLIVGAYEGIKVTTPQEFWAKYQDKGENSPAWREWTRMLLGK